MKSDDLLSLNEGQHHLEENFQKIREIDSVAKLKHMTCQNISESWNHLRKNCLF